MYIPDQIIIVIHPQDGRITILDGASEREVETRSTHIYEDGLSGGLTVQVTYPGNVTRTYQASQVAFLLAPSASSPAVHAP